MKSVVIIGAGFSGLAAAALLAKAGFSVTVIEKNSSPGGRAMVFASDGFTFDMGPSWYLMPEVFDRFFAEFGKKSSDYYTLTRLDPSYRVFFGPDKRADIASSLSTNLTLFDQLEADGGAKLKRYVDAAAYQYRVAMDQFIYKEYRSIWDFCTPRLLCEAPKLHLFESLHSYSHRFFTSREARQIVLYNTVFLGCDPKRTPALYSLMSHVDFNLGVWYPIGGMGAVVRGMCELCREFGVQFVWDTPIQRILTRDRKVRGVQTSIGEISAEIVVASADYAHVDQDLLAPAEQGYPAAYWEKRMLAPSALLAYVGLSKPVQGLKHHNLFLHPQWERHFSQIFDHPQWPREPCYYVSCPSKTDPTVAPAGTENLFFLVPLAAGLDDTEEQRAVLFSSVIDHLEKLTGEQFRSSIIYKKLFSHRDFIKTFNAAKGTALGLAHTLLQTALFRPRHKSKKISGLYHTGHFTHPGIGVPMVIISSTIVAKEITELYGHSS